MKIIPEHTNPLNRGEKNINSTHSLAKRKCDLLSERGINTAPARERAARREDCRLARGFASNLSGKASARTGKGRAGGRALASPQGPWAPSRAGPWRVRRASLSQRRPAVHAAAPPAAPVGPLRSLSCFTVLGEDGMLVASGSQGERGIQEGSSSLQTPG